MNMRHSCFRLLLAGLLVMGSVTLASAKDTALLIAITYRNAPNPSLDKNTLPGTARDMNRMREVVQIMGFEDVRTLLDAQATYNGIRSALADLSRSVKANDRVLVYYSGHGTRAEDNNGDEADGYDEALIPFDYGRADQGLSSVLRDDEFGELLRTIPSNRVYVLLDSCHSGTGTRAADLGGSSSDVRVRYFDIGVDLKASRAIDTTDDLLPRGATRDHFVNLMAARDVETAKESSNVGGLFTTALVDYVQRARQTSTCSAQLESMFATVQAQVVRAADDIRRSNPEMGAQTPQLEADDPALRNQTLAFKGIPGCNQPRLTDRMQYWSDFATAARSTLEFKTNASEMQPHPSPDGRDRCASSVGLLSMELTAPADGYVTLLNIGEGDSEATVVFPNAYVRDNRVRRGEKLIVPSGQAWCLPARLPANRTSEDVLVIAVFSETPINLFETGAGSGPFRQVGSGSRSFSAVAGRAARDPVAAAQTVVTIRK